MPVFWATGACMMVRSSSYHEAGGLDDSFFAHMEEIDLCWRFHRLGYTVHAVSDSLIYHIGGGSLKYDTPGKTYLNFRNNLYMLYKNLPPAGFRIRLFKRKMLDGAAAIMFLLRGKPHHFAAVMRAHRDYYKASQSLRASRKRLAGTIPYRRVPANLVLNKSIVLMFYLNRVRRFSDIMF
jgi:GT2 family glycosyltransferase